jgi:putative hydrolase of the HAD superfamily
MNKESKPKLIFPQLIFFDAAGTLIEVRGSVGEVYARWAQRYGVRLAPATLQERFARAFRVQPPLAFQGFATEAELQQLEFAWWQQLVEQVFAGVAFPRLADFFAAVFAHFSRAEAWQLYPDVVATLTELQARGVQLAVLSNFDTRLEGLLDGLGLAPYFAGVHLSARLGAAKPDERIFRAALQWHGLQPHEAWHVGDSWREDWQGANHAGLKAWLIDRAAQTDETRFERLASLKHLIYWLDKIAQADQ